MYCTERGCRSRAGFCWASDCREVEMNKSVLQNGDLLFMSDESDLSKAIIETTEKYSHVGIFFDGMFYHASRKRGVAKQKLEEYLSEEKHEVFIYR